MNIQVCGNHERSSLLLPTHIRSVLVYIIRCHFLKTNSMLRRLLWACSNHSAGHRVATKNMLKTCCILETIFFFLFPLHFTVVSCTDDNYMIIRTWTFQRMPTTMARFELLAFLLFNCWLKLLRILILNWPMAESFYLFSFFLPSFSFEMTFFCSLFANRIYPIVNFNVLNW